ncbi:hypothetical protein Tco_0452401 [Tanacetum coccineum]
MLPQDQEGEGARVAAQAVPPSIPKPIPEPMPEPNQNQDHLSTPPRQQTFDPLTSTNVEDEPLGGSFHAYLPRSTQAPPAGHTSGGAEDLIKITALSFVVSTFVQKVNSLETELKAYKQLFKDVVGKLVKRVKAIEFFGWSLEGLVVLFLGGGTVDSNIPPGGASNNPAASSHIPTDILLMMEDDRLGEEAAKKLHDEEQAQVDIQRAELDRRRKHKVLASAKHYSDADWIDIMAQVHANAGLSSELLGADVNDDNFAARMVALINQRKRAFAEQTAKEKRDRPMTPAQQREYMRVFVKNQSTTIYSTGWSMKYVKSLADEQLIAEFEKIRMAVADLKSNELRRTLKRAGEALEPDTSKKQKSTEAPIPSVPDVPQPKVVSSSKSSGSRRKSLGRSRITKPELDLDADDKTFIKVVSDEDSEDEAPILWSAFAGWEVISTPLGEINAMYMMDQSTKHFTTLREILHMGDLQVLIDSQEGGKGSFVWNHQQHWQIRSWRLYPLSNVHVLETVSGEVLYMFADVSYPLSVKLMERMLKHKLEIAKDVVGNDMTTAEQLIRFIKNQLVAAQVSLA